MPDTTSTGEDSTSISEQGAFALHLVCVAWILCVIILSALRHRDVEELRTAIESPDAKVRLEALFILGQREPDGLFQQRSPRTLLNDPDGRLREFAFSNSFTRNPAQRLTRLDLAQVSDPQEQLRASLWLHCRMTTPRRLTLTDLDAWFAQPSP